MSWLFAAVAVLFFALWIREVRRNGRAPEREVPPPPPLAPAADFMERALKEAPERFAAARRIEKVRQEIACVVCSEPTAIVCPACGSRVCLVHQKDHPCR